MELRNMIHIHSYSAWPEIRRSRRHGIHYLTPSTVLNLAYVQASIERLIAGFVNGFRAVPTGVKHGRLPQFCIMGSLADDPEVIYATGINPIVITECHRKHFPAIMGSRFINPNGEIDEMANPDGTITDSFRESVFRFMVRPANIRPNPASVPVPIPAPIAPAMQPEPFVMLPIHYALMAKPKRIGLVTDLNDL